MAGLRSHFGLAVTRCLAKRAKTLITWLTDAATGGAVCLLKDQPCSNQVIRSRVGVYHTTSICSGLHQNADGLPINSKATQTRASASLISDTGANKPV